MVSALVMSKRYVFVMPRKTECQSFFRLDTGSEPTMKSAKAQVQPTNNWVEIKVNLAVSPSYFSDGIQLNETEMLLFSNNEKTFMYKFRVNNEIDGESLTQVVHEVNPYPAQPQGNILH